MRLYFVYQIPMREYDRDQKQNKRHLLFRADNSFIIKNCIKLCSNRHISHEICVRLDINGAKIAVIFF